MEINWLPYIIDPGTAERGEDYAEYNRRRWGGDGWTHSLRQRGRAEGVRFADWRWWPNTLKAHRLVLFAQNRGISSSATKAAIFEALYEEGANVSEEETLANIAASKLGLNKEEVLAYLQSSDGVQEVLQEVMQAQQTVEGGVPFFVVRSLPFNSAERPYGFSGAQETPTLLSLFQKVAGRPPMGGNSPKASVGGCQ